jgi:Uma2 family endonuclease
MTTTHATLADLAKVREKAEIVGGKVVAMSPTGALPNRAGGNIYLRLREYEHVTQRGYAYTDNAAFVVRLRARRSFSPDAAFHQGAPPGMGFVEGAPVFAVEVRSEKDYGRAAERRMARKRDDYFAAGTLVVWDIDLQGPDVVRVYRAGDPGRPVIYRRGSMAEAEPALPGFSMPVDQLFE